jgi:hypothetical protein
VLNTRPEHDRLVALLPAWPAGDLRLRGRDCRIAPSSRVPSLTIRLGPKLRGQVRQLGHSLA